jgi:hypothetical protein
VKTNNEDNFVSDKVFEPQGIIKAFANKSFDTSKREI